MSVLTKRPPLGPYMGIVRIGGTREGAKGLPTLFAVAPAATASTINKSPVLYCYSSGAQVIKFVLTFTAVRANAPFTETEVRMDSEGLYRIDLQAAGLKPNTEYQWSNSTLTGKESSAKDTVTGGGSEIQSHAGLVRCEPLLRRLLRTDPATRSAAGRPGPGENARGTLGPIWCPPPERAADSRPSRTPTGSEEGGEVTRRLQRDEPS